ncbi:hypothetical protein Tco_0598832 [Tanacetum coccineum]
MLVASPRALLELIKRLGMTGAIILLQNICVVLKDSGLISMSSHNCKPIIFIMVLYPVPWHISRTMIPQANRACSARSGNLVQLVCTFIIFALDTLRLPTVFPSPATGDCPVIPTSLTDCLIINLVLVSSVLFWRVPKVLLIFLYSPRACSGSLSSSEKLTRLEEVIGLAILYLCVWEFAVDRCGKEVACYAGAIDFFLEDFGA